MTAIRARAWRRIHISVTTLIRECPTCGVPIASNRGMELHRDWHWDQETEACPEPVTAEPGADPERARPPLAERVPVAYEHRLIRGALRQVRELLRVKPAAELPPATIRQPPPVPVPSAVADMAARQVERAERRE